MRVYANRSDGKVLIFNENGGSWEAEYTDQPEVLSYDIANEQWMLSLADDSIERYNLAGKLVSITNDAGQTTSLSYTAGVVATITHFSGRSIAIDYHANGLISTMTDPAGNEYHYSWDGSSRLTTVTYPDETPLDPNDNPTRIYHYEDASFPSVVTGITDENGDRYTTYTYDAQRRATSSAFAANVNSRTVTYTGTNTVTVTNALGKDTDYTLTTQNDIRRIAQADGVPTAMCGATVKSMSYDANGFLDSRTDENGSVTNLTYNAQGLLESETEAVGTSEERTVTTTWHPTFRVPAQILKPGQTIDMTYDSEGRLLTRTITDTQTQSVRYHTNGNTQRWTYTYNALGLVETIDGPRTDVSDVTTFEYDANGDLWTTTNPLGQVTEVVSRDARGLPTAVDDMNDVRTDLEYDARGRLLTRTVKSGQGDAITAFGYDAAGQVTSVTLPDGSRLTYEYDAAHRLTAIQNVLGERVEYTLDAAGNHTGEVIKDDLGSTTKTLARVFDELSRVREIIGAATQTTTFTYDDSGNRTSIEDGLNRTTNQAYDALDRLVTVTDPLLNDAGYEYDERDNLVSVTDPRDVVTTYVYDGLDNLIQESTADAGTSVHVYDDAGNLTETNDARGVVTDYVYDALNRVVSVTYPGDPYENITNTYDQGSNGIGRLTSIQDASGSTDYSYDDRGNLTQETRVINGVIYVTSYGYDLADNLTSMTYPSGRTVTYSRDSLDRVSGITTQASGGPSEPVLSNISYLPFGGIAGWTMGNGLVETRGYDLDYRINSLAAGGVIDRSYSYDLAESIDGITDNLDAIRSQTFGYDELQRLTSASGIYGSLSYTYDAVGNRLTFDDGTATETSTYGVNDNRLDSSTSWDYQYDSNGNLTAKLVSGTSDGMLLAYNERNRLETVKDRASGIETPLAAYEYNALGQRVSKTTASDRHFVFDMSGQLIAEADATGAAAAEYLYLDGVLIGVVASQAASTPAEVIMDNTSSGTSQTGTWLVKTNASQYQSDYLLAKKNTNATFRWTPQLSSGTYEVYAWWVSQNSYNGSVVYTISHDGQSDQVIESHKQNGGQWVLLGSYSFSGGGSEYVEVTDQGGNSVADAIRFQQVGGGGGPSDPTLHFVHTDHLGTPQAISDDSQQVVWQADYRPFGSIDEIVATITNNARFPGQYYDAESGMHYNYFRDYSSTTGRYVESDPIGLAGGLNRYGYAFGNPISYFDPLGLRVEVCCQKADLPYPMSLFSHCWIKTDRYEAGMGGRCPNPGQGGCVDEFGSPVETTDHSGRSETPGATCELKRSIDEQCVDQHIAPGQDLGRWRPNNQCQSFVNGVVSRCTIPHSMAPAVRYLN